jgi:hypothetical protein
MGLALSNYGGILFYVRRIQPRESCITTTRSLVWPGKQYSRQSLLLYVVAAGVLLLHSLLLVLRFAKCEHAPNALSAVFCTRYSAATVLPVERSSVAYCYWC